MANEWYCRAQEGILPESELLSRTKDAMAEAVGRRKRVMKQAAGIGAAACAAGVLLVGLSKWKFVESSGGYLHVEDALENHGGTSSWVSSGPLVSAPKEEYIFFNDLNNTRQPDSGALIAPPEGAVVTDCSADEAVDYLGRDIRPGWLPEGMQPGQSGGQVIRDRDGKVLYDSLSFLWDEGGTEYDPLEKRVELDAAKQGARDCVYVFPDQTEASAVGGVTVQLGQVLMDYGPYQEQTHAPAGYFQRYVAEFTYGGIQCELLADNLSREEFTKVLRSILE